MKGKYRAKQIQTDNGTKNVVTEFGTEFTVGYEKTIELAESLARDFNAREEETREQIAVRAYINRVKMQGFKCYYLRAFKNFDGILGQNFYINVYNDGKNNHGYSFFTFGGDLKTLVVLGEWNLLNYTDALELFDNIEKNDSGRVLDIMGELKKHGTDEQRAEWVRARVRGYVEWAQYCEKWHRN